MLIPSYNGGIHDSSQDWCKVTLWHFIIVHRKLFQDVVLLDFSLTVKAATSIFISGCGSAISSAKEGKSGFIYNLVKCYKLFEPRKRACIS